MLHDKPQSWVHTQKLGEAIQGEQRLSLNLVNGNIPMIEDMSTGRQYTLEWPEIVDIAVIAFGLKTVS